MTHNKIDKTTLGLLVSLAVVAAVVLEPAVGFGAQDNEEYPEPRYPSYLRMPESVEEVMPYAQALVRNKSNILGLGLGVINPGESVLIVTSVRTAEEKLFTDAVKRALEERNVNATWMDPLEIAIDPAAARESTARRASRRRPSRSRGANGWTEASGWASGIPGGLAWLKERRPELYTQAYGDQPAEDRQPRSSGTVDGILKFLEDNPEYRGVFYGTAGPLWMRFTPHEDKWLGTFTWNNMYNVISEMTSYPADVWLLTEELTMEPLASVDSVRVTDPEGTDVHWEMTELQAQRWVKGLYLRGHLFMFPNEAYGQYALSLVSYPALEKEYIPPEPMVLLDGVIAGTVSHAGLFPRIEEHWQDGYMTEVRGGGIYGEIVREFMDYPNINDVTYPLLEHKGYFYHFETAMGTHPKAVRHPLDEVGTLPERMRSGALHWALGAHYWNDPGSGGGMSTVIRDFAQRNKVPPNHGLHIHNYFADYSVHLRNSNRWLNLVDKGHLTALDAAEVRALASRYGDPDEILAEVWTPGVPGLEI